MPELPEVETARRLIADLALGRRIVGVDHADTFVCRPHSPGELRAALTGRMLTAAHRRGKAIWCETSGRGRLGLGFRPRPGPLGPHPRYPPGYERPHRGHRPGRLGGRGR